MDEKSGLRHVLIAKRANAFAKWPNAGVLLESNFPSCISVFDQTVVAGYMPFRTEINPLPLTRLLVKQGALFASPRMNSPSHLWGGVGVGGDVTDTSPALGTKTAPHPPTPSPQVGRGGALLHRIRRLRAAPTKYEQKLWEVLRAKRPEKSHWRRQVAIGGYVYDFGCHSLKLLVEVDGGVHRMPEVQVRDLLKAEAAYQQGYRLIRLQNEDVLKIETAQYFDQYAKLESPSPLWGGVGVGGGLLDTFPALATKTAPHPPTPSPQVGRGEALQFHFCELNNSSHFTVNKMGLLEPVHTLPTATPTILLVPLLGFDRQGNRLGYGKGYYDTAIACLRANSTIIAIGVAFAEQEVESIPTQPHDQRLDWIITQNEAYRFPS